MNSLHRWLQKFLASPTIVTFALVALYLATHLYRLGYFPVFADESIYIRWAQLIIDDPGRYAFFALNDGKTPLFMWLMVPFQFLVANQLVAGRLVAVLVGLAQMLVVGRTIQVCGGRFKTQVVGMLLVIFLPFWFFHHRMALIDGLLTLFISLATYFLIRFHQSIQLKKSGWSAGKWIIVSGIFFGLGLWTKLPALFFLPMFAMGGIFFHPMSRSNIQLWKKILIWCGFGALIGLFMFVLLRLSPSFGQLFRRSSDFTFTPLEFVTGGWRHSLQQLPGTVSALIGYLTWPVVILSFWGVFVPRARRYTGFFILGAACSFLPFAILGKIVFARYLLPVGFFITVGAALTLQQLYDAWFNKPQLLRQKALTALILVTLGSTIVQLSSSFILPLLTDYDQIPFSPYDRTQYLEEWSSGHGISEATAYIRQQAEDHTIAVGTEGTFGTLPDGILLLLHRTNVNNISVSGVGQPIFGLSREFLLRAKTFDQTILVVNSHRLSMNLDNSPKVLEVCRPRNAPCLEVYDITRLVQQAQVE